MLRLCDCTCHPAATCQLLVLVLPAGLAVGHNAQDAVREVNHLVLLHHTHTCCACGGRACCWRGALGLGASGSGDDARLGPGSEVSLTSVACHIYLSHQWHTNTSHQWSVDKVMLSGSNHNVAAR